ncbi:MAG: GAF and ANTAR domain-containing protein [Actinomycetota bacterium]
MMGEDLSALEVVEAPGWSALQHLSRALHVKEADLGATLNAIVFSAAETIDAVAYAGVNLLIRGRFTPQATIGGPPPLLDAFQQRTLQGPCVDASRDQVTISVENMDDETRWPGYAELAVSLGVLSMLCVPLWVDEGHLGSLSLYATSRAAFSAHHAKLASLFATHAALALADAQRTDHLRVAAANRDVIGVAKGILVERYKITADEAFGLLSKASQNANRKLTAVAKDLVETGELP